MSEVLAIRYSADKFDKNPAGPEEALDPGAVHAQLERILASKTFSRSPRISRFLTFVVEQTLAGQEDKLKEYLLGVEVFNRMDSFDPRIDSIVRVEARRLRYKLERYYEAEGQSDSVLIQFRKGCYVPSFSNRNALTDELTPGSLDIPHLNLIRNPQAFGLFARGRHNLTKWTSEGVTAAISCFSQALEEDPDCVGAYAGLGTAWVIAGALGIMPAREVMPKARERAEQAVMLRATLPEAHAILGFVRAAYDWDWNEAEPILRRAVQSNPQDGTARLWYALYSVLCGRSDRAIHESHRAQQASPTSLAAHMAMAFCCHLGRNYDEAVLNYKLARDLDETFCPAHLGLALLFADQDYADRSLEAAERAIELRPHDALTLAIGAYAYSRAGRTEPATTCREQLLKQCETQYVPPVARAIASVSVGELEAALGELEEALEERSAWLACVPLLRAFEPLHGSERYEEVIAALRLPHRIAVVA
jgi:tetratricopeptide (TPR) repeat protein